MGGWTQEQKNAYLRERYANDPEFRESVKARARVHYHANREAAKKAAAQWSRDNPERRAATVRRYQERHPESGRMARARRRAMLRAADVVEHVDSLVVLERADGVCGICGDDVDPMRFDVDHVLPLALGGDHTYANSQPAHIACNRGKRAAETRALRALAG